MTDHRFATHRVTPRDGADLLTIDIRPPLVEFITHEWTVLVVARGVDDGTPCDVRLGSHLRSRSAVSGQCVAIPPGTDVILEPSRELRVHLLLLPDDVVQSVRTALPNEIPPDALPADEVYPTFEPTVARWLERLSEFGATEVRAQSAARWVLRRTGWRTRIPGPDDPLTAEAMRDVVEHMHLEVHKPLQVATLAGLVGLGRDAFSRSFKAVSGLRPHQYLTGLRVERAAALLDGPGEANLHGVAMECGFYDQSHLNRHFKRWMGMTPGQYLAKPDGRRSHNPS